MSTVCTSLTSNTTIFLLHHISHFLYSSISTVCTSVTSSTVMCLLHRHLSLTPVQNVYFTYLDPLTYNTAVSLLHVHLSLLIQENVCCTRISYLRYTSMSTAHNWLSIVLLLYIVCLLHLPGSHNDMNLFRLRLAPVHPQVFLTITWIKKSASTELNSVWFGLGLTPWPFFLASTTTLGGCLYRTSFRTFFCMRLGCNREKL